MTVNPLDMPAATEGRVVTQAHADYCAANGHATHRIDGVVQPYCPRCGDRTADRPVPTITYQLVSPVRTVIRRESNNEVLGTVVEVTERMGRGTWTGYVAYLQGTRLGVGRTVGEAAELIAYAAR